MTTRTDEFAARLLAWFAGHGRTDPPWQREPTPYRVWVSEIMLQQTQVATVIPYFVRFTARFPDAAALSAAPLDEVLHLWSGLGYYARARNLHRAACEIRDAHGGELPRDIDTLQTLPGIGRSTAGAILSLACSQRHPILDGNVKRVLTRYHAVEGWPGESAVQRRLWGLAEAHTPHAKVDRYTQAIMDLGATLCTRSRPRCADCPVSKDCAARAAGRQADFPYPKPRRALPVRATTFLILRNEQGDVLLQRRPPSGVWGGLWGFPECPVEWDPRHWCEEKLGVGVQSLETLAPLRHTFSHFHLDITPVHIETAAIGASVMEPGGTLWYNGNPSQAVGLAAPVSKLLTRLRRQPEHTDDELEQIS